MNITLNIIFESLGLEAPSGIGSREFARCLLVNDNVTHFKSNIIYLAPGDQALSLCRNEPDAFFMSIKDSFSDRVPDKHNNLVCVDFSGDLLSLYFSVQNEFFRIGEWNKEMYLSLINSKGLDDLLRLSEPILQNTIFITDSAFSLVAHAKNIIPRDDIIKKLYKKGYHDKNSVALLGGFDIISRLTDYRESGTIKIDKISGSVMMYRIHKFAYTYYNHTIMVCDHRPATPGLFDLFSMLVENLSVAIEANWNEDKRSEVHRNALFDALIDRQLTDNRTLDAIAAEAGIPLSGNYLFLEVRPKPVSQVPIARIIRELNEIFPNALIAFYHGIPMVLLFSRNDSDLLPAAIMERLTHFVEVNECFCGISEPYYDLSDTRKAYVQVNLALRFGTALKSDYLGPLAPALLGDSRILRFSGNSIYYILSDMSQSHLDMLENTKYGQLVTRLLRFEQGRQVPYLSILYTYLNCERNATLTGQYLHMHRNNVLYHISKIKDMIGEDLDDPHVRFQLMAACAVMTRAEKNSISG